MLVHSNFSPEKKRVNLYEPLMFTLADRPQPGELVVTQINKNQVKGYVDGLHRHANQKQIMWNARKCLLLRAPQFLRCSRDVVCNPIVGRNPS